MSGGTPAGAFSSGPALRATAEDATCALRPIRSGSSMEQATADRAETYKRPWTLINTREVCFTHAVTKQNEEQALRNRLLMVTPPCHKPFG